MSNAQELVPIEKRYEDVKLSAEYVESRVKYPKFVFETILDYVEKSVSILQIHFIIQCFPDTFHCSNYYYNNKCQEMKLSMKHNIYIL